MEGEHEHDQQPPVIAPVIEASNELAQPVIDHAEKITRLEERQSQQEVDLMRRLNETENQLRQAIEEGGRGASERIAALETRIEALLAQAEEVPAEVPEAVEFEVPEVETSPAPPEKMRRGIAARRKAKKGKK